MAPNVLLVVLDTARRDVLEPYGAPQGTTPAMAQLAARGQALPRAYSTASWTLPSHASMFTGLLPRALGLCQAPGGSPHGAKAVLDPLADRMLAPVLKRAGYETRGWSTNLWASGHAGFDAGFDSLEYMSGGREDQLNELLAGGVRAQLAWAREGLRARADDGAGAVRDALVGSIGRWSGVPTFWFVNLSECHSPYLPPRPWNDLDARDRVRAALEARRHLNFVSICLYAAGRYRIPAPAFERMRRLYQRAVSYMDDWLAGVLEALDARGILDDTLVIVTSDHGENFGEGGLIAHGFSLDERLVHVPLVMAGPGALTEDRLFSLAELPRLIAEAAGIAEHPWSLPELPEGVAVAQYDPMGGPDHPKVQWFAEKWQLDDEAVARMCPQVTCATDGRMKLVVRDGHESVYDLEADPEETRPLTVNGAADALRSALQQPAVSALATAASTAAPAPAAADGPSAEELEAIERQMMLLGYM